MMMRYIALFVFLISGAAFAAPTISISPASGLPGGQVAIKVQGAGGSITDFIWIEPVQQWFYLNGTQTAPSAPIASATINFTAPSTLGDIQVYLFNEQHTILAGPVIFTVMAPSVVSSLKCPGTVMCDKSTGDVTLTGPNEPGSPLCKVTETKASACVNAGSTCVKIDERTDGSYFIVMACRPNTMKWIEMPAVKAAQ